MGSRAEIPRRQQGKEKSREIFVPVAELLKQNNQEMNTIDVDGTNEKEVEYALTHLVPPAAAADVLVVGVDESTPVKMADTLVAPTEASLGSQFAIGDLFPERVGVVTGHRI